MELAIQQWKNCKKLGMIHHPYIMDFQKQKKCEEDEVSKAKKDALKNNTLEFQGVV